MQANCRYGCKGCKKEIPEAPVSKGLATIGITVYSVRPGCHNEVYQGPFQSRALQKPTVKK